jgi:acyl dehydratase
VTSSSVYVETERRIYLEDLQVGQCFISGTYRVDEDNIKAFASAWDPQPFHLDTEAAKDSLFGGLVASGMHTTAITMRLNVESGLPFAGGLFGREVEVGWPRPTRPGNILQVTSTIQKISSLPALPNHGIVTVRSETRNQHKEIVLVQTAKLLVSRRGKACLG